MQTPNTVDFTPGQRTTKKRTSNEACIGEYGPTNPSSKKTRPIFQFRGQTVGEIYESDDESSDYTDSTIASGIRSTKAARRASEQLKASLPATKVKATPLSTAPPANDDGKKVGTTMANGTMVGPLPRSATKESTFLPVTEAFYPKNNIFQSQPPTASASATQKGRRDKPASTPARVDPELPPKITVLDAKFLYGHIRFKIGFSGPIWLSYEQVMHSDVFEVFEDYCRDLQEAGWKQFIEDDDDEPIELASLFLNAIKEELCVDKVLRIKGRDDYGCVVQVLTTTVEVVRAEVKLLGLSNEAAKVCHSKFGSR